MFPPSAALNPIVHGLRGLLVVGTLDMEVGVGVMQVLSTFLGCMICTNSRPRCISFLCRIVDANCFLHRYIYWMVHVS